MTDPNKAAVLAKWPNAKPEHNVMGLWHIYKSAASISPLGSGKSKAEAWADAARRLNSTFQDRWQAESRRRNDRIEH